MRASSDVCRSVCRRLRCAVCGVRCRGVSRCVAVRGGLAVRRSCLLPTERNRKRRAGRAGLGLADSLIGFAPRITHRCLTESPLHINK